MIFGLEFAREQVWHPIIVIWAIAFVPITLTLLACWLAGGRNLLRCAKRRRRYNKLEPNAPGFPFFQRNSGSRLISSGRTSNPTDRSK
jgi:hypothetical protein